MDVMFWIWLGIIIVTFLVEIFTAELISIWFTIGAIPPFILSATQSVHAIWQVVIFAVLSAVLMLSLRKVTKKWLLRNSNEKTNTDLLIGKKCTLIDACGLETFGTVKINGVEWNAVGDKQQNIAKGALVVIVGLSGNKLIVKEADNTTTAVSDK